ncbi:MAG TPA: hypothetical protein VMZ74_03555 [Ramlibacter sp.]|nr:hypothetical protein [Ramlibacter sp.]
MNGRRKLLLVDDDMTVAGHLAEKLAKCYDVISTTDPRETAALAKREQPHVILCDASAALSAASADNQIPVVYLTAPAASNDDTDSQLHGGPIQVSKRAQLSELVQAIDRATGR